MQTVCSASDCLSMAFRSPRKSTWHKVSQVLPIWTSANTTAANLYFMSLMERFGITDARTYFQKLRISIAISVVVCAWSGAASDGLKGFVIGGLLGTVAPIALLWLVVMLSLIALFLAIYAAAWAVICWLLWWLLHS